MPWRLGEKRGSRSGFPGSVFPSPTFSLWRGEWEGGEGREAGPGGLARGRGGEGVQSLGFWLVPQFPTCFTGAPRGFGHRSPHVPSLASSPPSERLGGQLLAYTETHTRPLSLSCEAQQFPTRFERAAQKHPSGRTGTRSPAQAGVGVCDGCRGAWRTAGMLLAQLVLAAWAAT